MNEETPVTPPTEPTPPTPEVSENSSLNSLEKANKWLEDAEKVKNETKDWALRAEAAQAERILSGQADAGQQQTVEKTEDQKITDRCNDMLEGTGLSI